MPPPTDAQIDQTISSFHYAVYGNAASPADFDSLRKLLKNNYVEGMMSLLQNAVDSPDSLFGKSKSGTPPANATVLKPGVYQVTA